MVEVDGPVAQNEICFISLGEEKLMAEVIKVVGKNAYVQVFESTRGLKPDSRVEFQGHMLEVTLGPGILSRNYDGLQNDLDKMEGIFLKRGDYTDPLNREKKWSFKPITKAGEEVSAGDWLGEVNENGQPHKIMVPFKMQGTYTIKEIVDEGEYTVDQR
jgi:V/A-type H+/Na+-transporting ATPase subunit A